MPLTYKEAVRMVKRAADETPDWVGPLIAGGIGLGSLGILGLGHLIAKRRNERATQLTAELERVKARKALAQARKLAPKGTYIATTPVELDRYRRKFRLDSNWLDQPGDYWMLPLVYDGTYRGAIVNAPKDDRGTVSMPALLHEVGHAIDYDKGGGMKADDAGFFRRIGDRFIGMVSPRHTSLGGKEYRAWDYSGIPEGNPVRDSSLDTYNWELRTRLLRDIAEWL